VVLRPGTYTEGAAEASAETRLLAIRSDLAKQEAKRLRREAQRRAKEAARADRRRSKRGLAPRDSDGRDKINRARVTGKDGQAGRLLRQLHGRLEKASVRAAQSRSIKTYKEGIWMEAAVSHRDVLFRLDAGEVALGPARRLVVPDLIMRPTDRIALVGPNGTGKSTLLRSLIRRINIPPETLVYMPQEIGLSDSERILVEAKSCSPERLGHLMTIVRRLGSDPKGLLASTTPSPGEVRKLLLALGISRRHHLIIMDEPTNHLDLPSIECLEKALCEAPCGLLLVSHDERFLEKTTTVRWRCGEDRLLIQ